MRTHTHTRTCTHTHTQEVFSTRVTASESTRTFSESLHLPGESPIVERILGSFSKHWLLLEKAPIPLFGKLVRCSTHGLSFSKLIEWGFFFRCVGLVYSFRLLIGCCIVTIGKISTLPAQAMKTAT